MKVEDKVNELLTKHYKIEYWDCYNDEPVSEEYALEQRIQNALIVVDEVLWSLNDIDGEINMSNYIDWWGEIREELTTLKKNRLTMKFKGTGGEWFACCTSAKPHFLFAFDGEVTICAFHQKQDDGTELPLEEVQANAKLIQIAPEMLKMLQLIVEEYDLDIITGLDVKKVRELIKKGTE